MPVEFLNLILENAQEFFPVFRIDLPIRLPRPVVAQVTYVSVQLPAQRARKWRSERDITRSRKMDAPIVSSALLPVNSKNSTKFRTCVQNEPINAFGTPALNQSTPLFSRAANVKRNMSISYLTC